MTLAPIWRTRLFALGASFVAIWLGSAVAQQELAWATLWMAALLGLMIIRVQSLPLNAVLLGIIICGYIVGNRGFAQASPSTMLPLLPAELVLAIACTILAIQCALRRELPWRSDALNYAVLFWVGVGLSRLAFDVRPYGLTAIRDFAMVYYGIFFLLAQHVAAEGHSMRFLYRCLLGSSAILILTLALFEQFPDFFMGTLTLRGVPLIYYKGDLVGTFMAAGTIMAFIAFERTRQWRHLALSLALTAGMLSTHNRASMLGLGIVAVLLVIAGRWRFAIFQVSMGMFAALVLLMAAHLTNRSWEHTAIHSVYERVVSLVDPLGDRQYSGEVTFNKGDNNRFRIVWWEAVWEETMDNNPWLGLGFGYDLARRFVREYYPDTADEFSTRSPHNILLTIFGRMGALGLAPFLFIIALMLTRTIRAARRGPSLETALWCASWIILVSACFGVVLEGPMGAVVFWTALGLANATTARVAENPATPETPATAALPVGATAQNSLPA